MKINSNIRQNSSFSRSYLYGHKSSQFCNYTDYEAKLCLKILYNFIISITTIKKLNNFTYTIFITNFDNTIMTVTSIYSPEYKWNSPEFGPRTRQIFINADIVGRNLADTLGYILNGKLCNV